MTRRRDKEAPQRTCHQARQRMLLAARSWAHSSVSYSLFICFIFLIHLFHIPRIHSALWYWHIYFVLAYSAYTQRSLAPRIHSALWHCCHICFIFRIYTALFGTAYTQRSLALRLGVFRTRFLHEISGLLRYRLFCDIGSFEMSALLSYRLF